MSPNLILGMSFEERRERKNLSWGFSFRFLFFSYGRVLGHEGRLLRNARKVVPMSLSNITLSASVRQNLLSLQGTADLLATTQGRLATGKKVNSALDNPTNFFTAAGLDARASDISNLLDSIGNGVQVLQAANTGITSLSKLVDTAKSIANQVLQQPSGYSARSTVTSSAALGGTAANLVDGVTIKSGQTIIVAPNGGLPALTVTTGA